MTADERKRTAVARDHTFREEDSTPHFRISSTHLRNCIAVRTVALRGLIRTNANVVHFFLKLHCYRLKLHAVMYTPSAKCAVEMLSVFSGHCRGTGWVLKR